MSTHNASVLSTDTVCCQFQPLVYDIHAAICIITCPISTKFIIYIYIYIYLNYALHIHTQPYMPNLKRINLIAN